MGTTIVDINGFLQKIKTYFIVVFFHFLRSSSHRKLISILAAKYFSLVSQHKLNGALVGNERTLAVGTTTNETIFYNADQTVSCTEIDHTHPDHLSH